MLDDGRAENTKAVEDIVLIGHGTEYTQRESKRKRRKGL